MKKGIIHDQVVQYADNKMINTKSIICSTKAAFVSRWVLSLVILLISQFSLVLAVAQTTSRDSVTALVKVAMEKDHLPSLSVAVSKNGKVVFHESFGFADLENSVLASPKSVYRIGSISKSLTAAVVMAMHEKGIMNINDPVQKYCPSFPEKERPITIKQLLSHQGGIRHYSNQHFMEEFYSNIRYETSADAISVFKNDSLVATPGTKYHYSSFGYVLLGCAVEGADKSTYEQALIKYVLQPSGMNQTALDYPEKIIPYRVRLYEKKRDGSLINARQTDLSNRFPGGGIISTAIDLARFGEALLSGKILNKSTLETMWSVQSTKDGKSTGYALGWNESEDKNEVFHGGGSTGGTAYLYMLRDEKIVVSFLTNTEGWGQPRHKLAQDIAGVFMKKK